MPYISEQSRQKLNLHPGAILRGKLTKKNNSIPHSEDHDYTNLTYHGPCTEAQFRQALELSLAPDIINGFHKKISPGEKYIPNNTPPLTSIITIKINPRNFEIVEDSYKPGKIKSNFTDASGNSFRYLPITDLDFHDYAQDHHSKNELKQLNLLIQKQKELYLRIGLSRTHAVGERNGYWLQINGIYTFPDFPKSMRGFQE